MELLAYYISLTDTPGRFEPELPEQNLLNYAHRPNGNMPWVHLDTKWNMHYPSVQDLEGGVATLHEKWWEPVRYTQYQTFDCVKREHSLILATSVCRSIRT